MRILVQVIGALHLARTAFVEFLRCEMGFEADSGGALPLLGPTRLSFAPPVLSPRARLRPVWRADVDDMARDREAWRVPA